MSSHEILHQSSCAYTPQQNGVVEPKNHYLVETAHTLLLHHKVPQRFWGGAIFATCYLINRMPSSVFHDQIPHSILFPNQPLFCLPPRVFGCVYFVHILTHEQDKLSAKATKCAFLGYSRLQRGYRCYYTDTNRSLLMSLSFRVPLSSPLKSILMFRMSYMSLLSYHLQISLLHL